MTTTVQHTSVKTAIAAAFKALRRKNICARMNFMCCMSCGYAAMNDMPKRYAAYTFYHKQDAEAFDREGNLTDTLHLAHSGNPDDKDFGLSHEVAAALIVNELREHGLRVQWAGDCSRKIEVLGLA